MFNLVGLFDFEASVILIQLSLDVGLSLYHQSLGLHHTLWLIHVSIYVSGAFGS
jgi:hypothetical protein